MNPDARPRPVVLCILDGWGHSETSENNAIRQARTPTLDGLYASCPHALIDASEHEVGLPAGQMGNSEVGHMNLGAGRIVLQDLPHIDRAVETGEIRENPVLKDFIDRESVEAVVAAVAAAGGGLDEADVLDRIFDDEWEERALKQRIRHIAVSIRSYLPSEFAAALRIMREAARTVDTGWMSVWAFNDFVEEFGVEYPDLSLPALEQFTKLASAEFAVSTNVPEFAL